MVDEINWGNFWFGANAYAIRTEAKGKVHSAVNEEMVLRLQKEGDEVKQQPQKLSAASISQPPHKDIRKKREAQKARRAKNIVRFRAANKGREPFRSETNTR